MASFTSRIPFACEIRLAISGLVLLTTFNSSGTLKYVVNGRDVTSLISRKRGADSWPKTRNLINALVSKSLLELSSALFLRSIASKLISSLPVSTALLSCHVANCFDTYSLSVVRRRRSGLRDTCTGE